VDDLLGRWWFLRGGLVIKDFAAVPIGVDGLTVEVATDDEAE